LLGGICSTLGLPAREDFVIVAEALSQVGFLYVAGTGFSHFTFSQNRIVFRLQP